MAPQAATTFNLAACALAIDEELITGFADGDVLSFERFSDAGGYSEGSDGLGMYAHNPSKSYRGTFRLMGNSRGFKRLAALYEAAEAAMDAGGAHPVYGADARDPLHGTSMTSPQVFFDPQAMFPSWQAAGLGPVEVSMIWTNCLPQRGTAIV